LSGLPVVGEEFFEAAHPTAADAMGNGAKVDEEIVQELAVSRDRTGESGGGSPSVIASEEQPVPLPDASCPQAAPRAVAVDLQVGVLAAANEGFVFHGTYADRTYLARAILR
jgi:hypothetical protein